MTVLCLWELTKRDSAAEVILALFFFFSMLGSLAWASLKVFRIAQRSVAMHKNPAYILYSDPTALNKWGFLYVQFRATAYYFIIPVLVYILVKGIFVALAQSSGVAQAVGLVIVEAVFLIGVSILRPWMDKKTNAFNIAIAAINMLNVIFLLVFTSVFNQPVSRLIISEENHADVILGYCHCSNGCNFFRHQRRVCNHPHIDGAFWHGMGYFLQESRHSLSTYA